MGALGHSHIPVSPGRPRLQLDDNLIRELFGLGYGYKRIANEYIRLTGQYVCHMTVRDRLTKTTAE